MKVSYFIFQYNVQNTDLANAKYQTSNFTGQSIEMIYAKTS